MKLKVSEVFYSLQGEGARAGQPSLFVRLSGCDLACGFCDTEFESGAVMDIEAIHSRLLELSTECRWIVWTGGEPSIQLTAEVVRRFKELGYSQAIETNGNRPVPEGLDWVACSPKVAEHVLKATHPNGVDELRYVRHSGQPGIPTPSVNAKRYFLSPMFKGNLPDPKNVRHCIDLCLANPKWELSVQSHKLLMVL